LVDVNFVIWLNDRNDLRFACVGAFIKFNKTKTNTGAPSRIRTRRRAAVFQWIRV